MAAQAWRGLAACPAPAAQLADPQVLPELPAWIMDADGQYVWLHNMGEVTRARMSYDGKHMWMCKGNVPEGQAKMIRVAMDGSDEQDLSSEFAGLHHDFTVLPDESIVFIAYSYGCDDVKLRSPDGQVSTIFNLGTVGSGDRTGNSIHYFEGDDSIIVSDWDQHHYVKLNRNGQVQWVLGGITANSFSGSGASRAGDQHGHHILAADQLVIFNNGSEGVNATVFEVTLDTGSMTGSTPAATAANSWVTCSDSETETR